MKRENDEESKEYEKCKYLYYKILNQIKELDCRLEEKNNIVRYFEE